MSRFILENDMLKLEIESYGGEMKSLISKKNSKEYLWCADKKYWRRTSPILFPFVGSLKDGKYVYNRNTYTSGQHGFARDMDFDVKEHKSDSIWFSLKSNDETKIKYPFDFELLLGYELKGNQINVFWKVINSGNETMYFSIGGHPAFMCPILDNTQQSDYYFKFDTCDTLKYLILDNGLVSNISRELETKDGYFKITNDLFDDDALIIENNQAKKVCLCMPDKTPYLTVKFDAPLFGLWSPAKKNAPFICIEPWYGRADASNFSGQLQDRTWGNSLDKGKTFEKSYSIIIE